MDTDIEESCLRLNGLKFPQTERQKHHKSSRNLQTDINSQNEPYELCLSTRVMEHPITPPNSPLVMQMYNHKKARESVMKRVREQTDRVKRKRLVYLKTSSVLEPMPTPDHENAKSRNSHKLNHVKNRHSSKSLPIIDVSSNSYLTGGPSLISDRNAGKYSPIEIPCIHPVLQQNNRTGKSDPKIQFDTDSNFLVGSDHICDGDDINCDDDNNGGENYNDENDEESDSYDSFAIHSIFVNNCSNENVVQQSSHWSRLNIPKNISWSPLHESYKGYLYKSNGDIVLTRKYHPPTHTSHNTTSRIANSKKFKPHNKTYRWGYMDPGRILNKQITALSISGTHV